MSWRNKLLGLISSPRVFWLTVFLAIVLTLPSLGGGYILDDHTHRRTFDPTFWREGGPRGAWDLFRFQDGNREYLKMMMDRGLWPWWTSEDFRLAFLRPLASVWHTFDHRVFDGHPWVMHLENIILYALLCIGVGLFYRRIMGFAAAGAAMLLYAIDDTHSMIVLWVANRNALLAALFGIYTLYFYTRWRQDNNNRDGFLSSLFFTLALASGEAALAICAYLLGYALFIDKDNWSQKIKSLLPYFSLATAWLAVYRWLGFGATGGDFYIDPLREPVQFLWAIITRAPFMWLSQLALPPSEIGGAIPEDKLLLVSLVVFSVCVLILVALWRLAEAHQAKFFLVFAGLVSIVPVCATLASDRLLLICGFGLTGLLGAALVGEESTNLPAPNETTTQPKKTTTLRKIGVAGIVFIHVIVAMPMLPAKIYIIANVFTSMPARAANSLPPLKSVADKTVIVVNAPDPLVTFYGMASKFVPGDPVPQASRLLGVILQGEASLSRISPSCVRLFAQEGLLRDQFSPLFRKRSKGFDLTKSIELEGVSVQVEQLTQGRPSVVRFCFDRELEDPKFEWIIWRKRHFEPFAVPQQGESAPIDPINLQNEFTID